MSGSVKAHGRPIYLARVAENQAGEPAAVVYSDDLERVGQALTRGVLVQLAKYWLLGTVLLAVLAALVTLWFGHPDATDVSKWDRSDMKLRTDHGTGCQYLESSAGALTPRLDVGGRPVCGVRP